MKKWKCTVCGYIHEGERPPEQCPVCHAERSKFIQMEEKPVPNQEPSKPRQDRQTIEATQKKPVPPQADLPQTPLNRWAASPVGKWLTRWHGHPVAVHIPNGVLPVAFLFALLAAIFDSAPFAIAAQYNIGFITLSMPIVIATGLIDWVNGFKGRMTRVFRIKMICAGIVTALSLVVLMWGVFDPGVYLGGFPGNWFFLLLYSADLGAAMVAGWYGGKLVFRK